MGMRAVLRVDPRRLAALQNFLKEAKAGGGLGRIQTREAGLKSAANAKRVRMRERVTTAFQLSSEHRLALVRRPFRRFSPRTMRCQFE